MKVIVRIKGGLGNQLFCYAAARRLALVNNAELIIDDVTGFIRDYDYNRKYSLDNFQIPCRKATPFERFEPFSRYRRALYKLWSKKLDFSKRRYVEQEFDGLDTRLLSINLTRDIYVDGLWQSEAYFFDVAHNIREDLQFHPPTDDKNLHIKEKISCSNAVALHVRWFDMPGESVVNNISSNYYRRAISMMKEKVDSPIFFLFSDNPVAAIEKIGLDESQIVLIDHNIGDDHAYADLWLMSSCKHFITANSTFSWWGAWLGADPEKIVIIPDAEGGNYAPFNLSGEPPKGWVKL